MVNVCKAIPVFLFFLLIFSPIFNDLTDFYTEKAPKGMRLPRIKNNFSLKNILERTWQHSLQDRAKKRSGLWLPGVKLGNEMYIRLFSQTSAFPSKFPFNLTKNGGLFKMEHLNGFNRDDDPISNQLITKVKYLKRFQTLIKSIGKTTVFIITPNLTSIYPELVPDEFVRKDRLKRRDHYKELLQALDLYKVDYVDTQSLLLKKKNDYPFHLFAPSGSHWNDVGSCAALKAVNEKLWEVGKGFRRFSCNKWQMRRPRKKDMDLALGLNLYNKRAFLKETPYIDIQYTSEPLPQNPTVLAIGTSYLSAFMEHMNKWRLTQKTTMYFYFRRQKINGWEGFVSLDKSKINWDEIFHSDIILMNVGMNELNEIGYGFIEAALQKRGLLH